MLDWTDKEIEAITPFVKAYIDRCASKGVFYDPTDTEILGIEPSVKFDFSKIRNAIETRLNDLNAGILYDRASGLTFPEIGRKRGFSAQNAQQHFRYAIRMIVRGIKSKEY